MKKCESCGQKTVQRGSLISNDEPVLFKSGRRKDPKITAYACQNCGHVELKILQGDWNKSAKISIEMAIEILVEKSVRTGWPASLEPTHYTSGKYFTLKKLAKISGVPEKLTDSVLKDLFGEDGVTRDYSIVSGETLVKYHEHKKRLQVKPLHGDFM